MRFLPSSSLEEGMILAKSIISQNKAFMLVKGTRLTQRYVEYLQEKGYLGAYVTDDISRDIVVHETVDEETFEAGVDAVAQQDVPAMIDISKNLVSQICSNPQVEVELLDIRSYDDYTYHHSVNVAVYAVAVGRLMGLSENQLVELATAGICHDLGKSRIPLEILNKPGKLTDEEYEVIKNHSKLSYDILYEFDSVAASVRQAVLMHHENENGTGYPLGRTGDEIPLYAKIIHAVDVYDALTSRRPYKQPYSNAKANEYMHGGAGIQFDPIVVEAMDRVLPIYPPGMKVRLSNGEEAVVISLTRNPLRPVIRLIKRMAVVNLETNHPYEGISIEASGVALVNFADEISALNESRSAVNEQKKKVMVVEDSPISMMQTKSALGDAYQFISITSGIEAIQYLKTSGVPDLIIMDIEMPVLNGISAVRTMRENGYTDVPVIFLTASCDRETVLKGMAVGARDYIIKPASPTYLRERVIAALEGEIDR